MPDDGVRGDIREAARFDPWLHLCVDAVDRGVLTREEAPITVALLLSDLLLRARNEVDATIARIHLKHPLRVTPRR